MTGDLDRLIEFAQAYQSLFDNGDETYESQFFEEVARKDYKSAMETVQEGSAEGGRRSLADDVSMTIGGLSEEWDANFEEFSKQYSQYRRRRRADRGLRESMDSAGLSRSAARKLAAQRAARLSHGPRALAERRAQQDAE